MSMPLMPAMPLPWQRASDGAPSSTAENTSVPATRVVVMMAPSVGLLEKKMDRIHASGNMVPSFGTPYGWVAMHPGRGRGASRPHQRHTSDERQGYRDR